MSKVTLAPVADYTQLTLLQINSNMDKVKAALENTLSRDGTSPNQMEADLDMNNKDILNVKSLKADKGSFSGLEVNGVLINPSDKSFEPTVPELFGAKGDWDGTKGTDDTIALQTAIDLAVSTGRPLKWPGNKWFKIKKLTVPTGAVWEGSANLRYDGSISVSTDTPIVFGADVKIDEIKLSSPGAGEINLYSVELGARTTINYIEINADTQKAASCVTCKGDGEQIDYLKTKNIDRPLIINNSGGASRTKGAHVGFIDAENYLRGFSAVNTNDWTLGGYHFRGRSLNASVTPGHNGLLIDDCDGWVVGDGIVADSGEHAIRLSGTTAGCKNAQMGLQTVMRSGGCALKINPFSANPCRNIAITGVHGIDVGDSGSGGNKELARISHARNIRIGTLTADVDQASRSAQYMLQLNDVDGLHVAALGGISNSGISVDETSDADGSTTFAGPVRNIFIDKWFGKIDGSGSAMRIAMSTQTIADIFIRGIEITGYTTNLFAFVGSSPVIAGDIVLQGRVFGAVRPVWSNVPADTKIQIDLEYGSRRFRGHPNNLDVQSNAVSFAPDTGFSEGNQKATGIEVQNKGIASSLNAYGNGLEVTRLGSTRRGGAIVPAQTGAADNNVGWAFFGGPGSAATDALILKMLLKHSGVLNLPLLPTYATDSAAGTGGLVAGDIYKTATGELRIKI